MPRDYKQQLDDILQAITFIREYVKAEAIFDVCETKINILSDTITKIVEDLK